MLSKIFFSLLAVGSALAAPGGDWGNGGDHGGEECYTTCSTELCTQSTVYYKTTEVYETTTLYAPVTTYAPSTNYYTETLTSKVKTSVCTSTPTTIVSYVPVTYETYYEVPYTSVCSEVTNVPVVTSTAYASVCTEEKVFPYTTAWVETQTTCATVTPTPAGGWGSNKGW